MVSFAGNFAKSSLMWGAACLGGILVFKLCTRWRKRKIDYEDFAVLITGCDSGFGYSLALHAARSGLTVFAGCYGSYVGNTEGLASLESESEYLGKGRLRILHLDVTSLSSIVKAKEEVQRVLAKKGKRLLGVVNNAGFLIFGEAEWLTLDQVIKHYHVNTIGPWHISTQFLPLLRTSTPYCVPKIINVISFCTDCPLPLLAVYTSSKAALKSLSSGMRMEARKHGVSVVMFNPGDHPSETRMCCDQKRHYLEMNVPEEPRFRDYFLKCMDKFDSLFPAPPLQELNNPGLYRCFDEILNSEDPRAEYVNSDLLTKAFFLIIHLLPTKMSDQLRLNLLRLPDF